MLEFKFWIKKLLSRLQETESIYILTDKAFIESFIFIKPCVNFMTPFSVEENEGLTALSYEK